MKKKNGKLMKLCGGGKNQTHPVENGNKKRNETD